MIYIDQIVCISDHMLPKSDRAMDAVLEGGARLRLKTVDAKFSGLLTLRLRLLVDGRETVAASERCPE